MVVAGGEDNNGCGDIYNHNRFNLWGPRNLGRSFFVPHHTLHWIDVFNRELTVIVIVSTAVLPIVNHDLRRKNHSKDGTGSNDKRDDQEETKAAKEGGEINILLSPRREGLELFLLQAKVTENLE